MKIMRKMSPKTKGHLAREKRHPRKGSQQSQHREKDQLIAAQKGLGSSRMK